MFLHWKGVRIYILNPNFQMGYSQHGRSRGARSSCYRRGSRHRACDGRSFGVTRRSGDVRRTKQAGTGGNRSRIFGGRPWNAVLPGWVRTEMAERSARHEARDRGITAEQVWEERAALYPPGRVATPEEVAEMIAFLASEESSGVSGEAIRVALGSVW
jgi:hypothetical protein